MTPSLPMSNRLSRLNLTDPVTPSFVPNHHYNALFFLFFPQAQFKSTWLAFAALSRPNHNPISLLIRSLARQNRISTPILPGEKAIYLSS